jgi:glycosyltransferase involved in cell wall biosynthesis
MRIAYIAPYQGHTLVSSRPCLGNLSLGGRIKIELIAELLRGRSHTVEILSQGEVIERQLKYYPAFPEPKPFHPEIPVHYASAFPVRFVNGFWSSRSMLRLFKARHRVQPFDAVLIYNLKPPQVACANHAIKRLGLPVILEYEDDQFLGSEDAGGASLTSAYFLSKARKLLTSLSGCVSGSPALLAQVTGNAAKVLMCGVVSEAILEAGRRPASARRNWVVFSGTHSKAQGLEQLIHAWNMAQLPDWELHIAGHGAMTAVLHELAAGNPGIVFHGLLDRVENARMLGSGRIAIVPYDVSATQGFSFKTVECLAAGLHVISTPLAALEGLEDALKSGITLMDDNAPATIAGCLERVIGDRHYDRTAQGAAAEIYSPDTIAGSLEALLEAAVAGKIRDHPHRQRTGLKKAEI